MIFQKYTKPQPGMGNCLRQQQQSWTAEGGDGSFAASSTTDTTTTTTTKMEVKIKITKKELEELLVKMDVKELRVEQVLEHLMGMTSHSSSGCNSWKPALQSIPEVN